MSFEYTAGQRLAIESRGSAVLVSAAAGSGKTRVLTERLLRYVSDASAPADIDRFLVITYTRAAAAELRARIMDALAERSAASPNNAHLRRQQTLCYRAPIGTIHSFCTAVLREYCQLLELSPAFSVLEEERSQQLKRTIASRLLDKRYESIETDADFRLLADTVGAGREDRRLEETLLDLYEKLRSHPYPEDWAAQQKSALAAHGITDIGETVWGREVLESAAQRAQYWADAMDAAVQEITAAPDGGKLAKAYGASFAASAEALRDFCRALRFGWDRARKSAHIEFPRLGVLRAYGDEALQSRLKATRDQCKEACKKLEALFAQDSETLLRDLRTAAPAMNALLDLALDFDRAYAAEKKRRGVLDFSDLEHYAARLLVDKATGAPTWVAAELSQRYTEIMVDEYQDVNAVQELIFRAVSRNGSNLFMVGDVKQSIYRFRLADPGLFLEKYRSFVPAERAQPGEARRILLQENFRSRRSVLDAANHVFSNIMSVSLGELDYDDDAALKFGAQGYNCADDMPVELHLIDTAATDSDDEPPEAAEAEARFVAETILSMVREGAPVAENGAVRPCTWGDFVLLMRTPGGKGHIFHRILSQYGIPVESQQGGGFFSSLEVAVTVNLLSVIDNPHTDIPLISVLRSPAFGFTADELSAIRAADRSGDFYTALCAAAESGNARCAAFLSRLGQWRTLAPEIGLDELVWRLCSETGLFAICAAMRDGELRRRNLMHLFEYARSFGESGYRGVFRFVQWLRRLEEKGMEPQTVSVGQAVRIMSIHKSKGLEFPFVFLCDLAHRFNLSDARVCVPVHSALGLGPKRVDTERGVEYPTIARRAIEQRLKTETLSEEMRVLYVGMTRAKERLFLSCVQADPERALEKHRTALRTPLPPELLRGASSFAPWLMLTALLAPDKLPICIHSAPDAVDAAAPAQAPTEVRTPQAAADSAAELLRGRLDFVYPRSAAVDLPSKLTATELKNALREQDDPDCVSVAPSVAAPDTFRRAEPGKARKTLSAAQRGSAAHAFLEHVSLDRTDTPQALRDEAQRLCSRGLLRPEELDALDFGALERLFSSPLGKRIRSAASLRREFRFLLLCSASDYFDAPADDRVLLQGVVDCCFEENGGITVVDYKTDRVSPAEVPARAELYRVQLRTYAQALERIFGLPVNHCILWFLHSGTEYELNLAND
ncbi:MAG: helicase-exonuclease AddAB subunit AddA [Ruminococcaceae bacterium]|nr:helicase-exonuclease AddAB subunit AddA [Oscillospiraceae bacterium]